MKKIFILIVAISFLFSCQKENEENTNSSPTNLKDLVVNKDFNWQSYNTVKINVNVNGAANKTEVVYLLDDQSRRIAVGKLSNGKVMFNVNIPSDVPYLKVLIPATHSILEITDYESVSSFTMNYLPNKNTGKFVSFFASPDCEDGCTRTISTNVSNLNINDGEVVGVSGNISGTVTLNGNSTLRICGSATIQNFNFNGTGTKTIIITNYGSFTMSNFSPGQNIVFYNYSNNCSFSNFQPDGQIYNMGSLTSSTVNINNSASFINYGTMSVSGTFTVVGTFENTGTVNAGNIVINTQNANNSCKMISSGDITFNYAFENSGYMVTANNMLINTGSTVYMYYEAMLSTKNLTLNGTVDGGSSMGELKVSNSTLINGNGKILGDMDFCDLNGIETNNGTIASSVTSCSAYIPVTSCNPEGFGVPVQTDTDNDGIIDNLDEFPTDADLAFKNYSPYAGYKTIAFEDLWPAIGDFDFNDLMIKTKIEYYSNNVNNIVKANVTVVLSAAGAGLHNGIGLQFLNSSNVKVTNLISSVSGAAIDPADNNCIKITNDVFESMSTYYTNTNNTYCRIPDTLKFTIEFNSSALFNFDELTPDFYIFRSNDRGLEIHVANRPPTAAMNFSYFNTSQDASNPPAKVYYKTKNNVPWGFELMDGNGAYKNPMEKIPISDAYTDFLLWVQSSGNSYQNWYQNPIPSKVFTKVQN